MEYKHCITAALDELCIEDASSGKPKGRMGRRRYGDGDDSQYKSKNLGAERRRREKLSQRLLTLRSHVPIITNMNKGTIIEDAITYITELQKNVKVLSDQLLQMELAASIEEEILPRSDEMMNTAKEMEKNGIKPDVKVTSIEGNRLWMKIIFEKRNGRFTRLMEALCSKGLELTDTNVTTSGGAIMVSSCIEGIHREMLDASRTSELIKEIITSI